MQIEESQSLGSVAADSSVAARYAGGTDWSETVRKTAFTVVDLFEGGKPESLQTTDSGMISYGRHQATLQSGALEAVIQNFAARGSNLFAPYMEAISRKDPVLKSDRDFLDLLKRVALEPRMQDAQNQVFSENYWQPSVKLAQQVGIESPLGFLVYYDTNIQGGLKRISALTANQFLAKGQAPDERTFLKAFLNNRRDYLLAVAANKRINGDLSSAQALSSAAQGRVRELQDLVENDNLALAGRFLIRGTELSGINYR